MSTYAIGDVQGCYDSLQALLEEIHFNEHNDCLWFVGDLINRGPKSLATLRFIKTLNTKVVTVLGNHDLNFLAAVYTNTTKHRDDTLDELLNANDREELCYWLRQKAFLHHDEQLGYTLVHAGIYPSWDLTLAQALAKEVGSVLQSEQFVDYLNNMYGNHPDHWSNDLQGFDRLRVITNAFTRMRLCTLDGRLNLHYKGTIEEAPKDLLPWYEIPNRRNRHLNIIFGHWAALECKVSRPNLFAIDSGCCWGKQLTALCLETKQRFQVECRE